MRLRTVLVPIRLLIVPIVLAPNLLGQVTAPRGGPPGGYVSVIVMDPKTHTTIYAAVAGKAFATGNASGGAVFRSTDTGITWVPANVGLPTSRVTALTIDPNTGSTLYAGTDSGLFKSTNSGQSWQLSNVGLTSTVVSVVVDPKNSGTLYAAAGGIYKSSDGGQSWTKRYSNGTSLVIDPVNTSILYACDTLGVYKSGDSGQTWVSINTGLPANYPYTSSLAIDPTNPSTVYAGGWYGGFYKSTDGGQHWTLSNSGMAAGGNSFYSVAINPRNPAIVFAGSTNGPFRSMDGGQTWAPSTAGLTGLLTVSSVIIDSADPATVYLGSLSGLFKSTDNGESWTQTSNGIAGQTVGQIALDPLDAAIVYALATNSGTIYKSLDAGQTWSPLNSTVSCFALEPGNAADIYGCHIGMSVSSGQIYAGLDKTSNGGQIWTATSLKGSPRVLVVDPTTPSTIYVGGGNEGLSKSVDGGQTWIAINSGLPSPLSSITALAVDPRNSSTLYVEAASASGGVYKTTDGGQTWSAINLGFQSPESSLISSLVIDPSNSANIFAGSVSGRIYKSINAGQVWTSVSSGLPGGPVTSIVVNSSNSALVYAAFDGGGVFGSGVFKSLDGGLTWTAVNAGLPGTGIASLAIDVNNPSTLYAGTVGFGLFRSLNGGQNWLPTTPNLVAPSISLRSIANAATNSTGSVAPGEIVTIYGSGLGPTQLVQSYVNSAGRVDTQLAGTRVLVNGVPAPLLYSSATQVAAVVPYSTQGTAQFTVSYQGQTTQPIAIQVLPSAPGLFTLDSSGTGQVAGINQDGSINTPGQPAPIGSVISLFATGEGQTFPGGIDGKPTQTPLPRPIAPVTLIIGGQIVIPQYAGGAPGEVAGLMQINAQIPAAVRVGNAIPVVLQVGNISSTSIATISVRAN